MATTQKRRSISFTKEDERQFNVLMQFFAENSSQIVRRALILLHYDTFHEKNNNATEGK